MKIISLYAGDVATEIAEESPKDLTPAQLARRRRMAIILCAGALNETSLRMARRLCRAWFPNCECVRGNEERRVIFSRAARH